MIGDILVQTREVVGMTTYVVSGHHGYGPYTRGCRCSVCRDAKREYMQNRRKSPLPAGSPLHGTYTGYDSHNCRCWPCVLAKREYRARSR